MSRDESAIPAATYVAAFEIQHDMVHRIGESPMARGNRNSAVRGSRSPHHLAARRRIEGEVESTIRDGMSLLSLVFRGVSMVVRYHEVGETDAAFGSLCTEVASLDEAAGCMGLSAPAIAELVLGRIEDELSLMYDTSTADRLAQALRECFHRSLIGGHR
jgi:hypothetical protein